MRMQKETSGHSLHGLVSSGPLRSQPRPNQTSLKVDLNYRLTAHSRIPDPSRVLSPKSEFAKNSHADSRAGKGEGGFLPTPGRQDVWDGGTLGCRLAASREAVGRGILAEAPSSASWGPAPRIAPRGLAGRARPNKVRQCDACDAQLLLLSLLPSYPFTFFHKKRKTSVAP
jgi:hypothetical protein